MINALEIVLASLPGPKSRGVPLSVVTKRCNREHVGESDCWAAIDALVKDGSVERFEDTRSHGTRLYYRLAQTAEVAA